MATNLRSKVWLCVGIAAIVMVIGLFAVACGGSSAGPEETVLKMLAAYEGKDADAFFALMDPDGLEQVAAMGMTEEQLKALMVASMTYDSMEFSDVELESEISDDGQTAVVTVVAGVVTIVEDGETTTEDVTESDEPQTFDLVLRDGKWYLDVSSMM